MLSPVTFGLSTTVHVKRIPLVVVLLLVTVMLVAVLSHIVSSSAVIVTVGSTYISTVIGVPEHSLSPLAFIVHGVIVYCTSSSSVPVLSSVCTISVPISWPLPALLLSPVTFGLSTTVHV